MRLQYLAKNVSFDIDGKTIDRTNLKSKIRINLFSGNLEEADEIFISDYEKLADSANITVKEITSDALLVDIEAEWEIPEIELQASKSTIERIYSESNTWNDMVAVFFEDGENIIDIDTIEEVSINPVWDET